MLTPSQRSEFDELGLLRLPGAVAPEAARAMQNKVWEAMAAKGMRRDAPDTWVQVSGSFFRRTSEAGAFEAIATPPVRQALDGLFGEVPWQEPEYWGGPMITFPNTPHWEIPRGGWHLDGPAGKGDDGVNRIVVFVFLEKTEPGGGGTVVAAGSHKVIGDLVRQTPGSWSSAEVRKALLRDEPWFGELLSKEEKAGRHERLTQPTPSAQGHPLRVIECTGEAGDVFMTHPWLYHGGAPNARPVPRQMLKEFIHRREAAPQ